MQGGRQAYDNNCICSRNWQSPVTATVGILSWGILPVSWFHLKLRDR